MRQKKSTNPIAPLFPGENPSCSLSINLQTGNFPYNLAANDKKRRLYFPRDSD
jgi:hypothetical protein